MWWLGFLSRNSCAHQENRIESCWDGCAWVHVMLEIAESLSEMNRMVLMLLLVSAKCLAIDMPAASANNLPL